MRTHRSAFFVVCAALLIVCTTADTSIARESLWNDPVRGSWVQTGSKTTSDVSLVSTAATAPIVVNDAEPYPVRRAAGDLAEDIEKITGQKPDVVSSIPSDVSSAILIGTVDTSSLITDLDNSGAFVTNDLRGEWESFKIQTLQSPGNGLDEAVAIAGANMRGTIFGIYQLSERLGIDPFYHFTGKKPTQYDELTVKENSLNSGEPTFKYRGMFHNDMDLAAGAFKHSVYGYISVGWYRAAVETALRLRFNMVAPDAPYVRPPEFYDMCNNYGIAVTSHHYDFLLSWPNQVDKNPLEKPELENLDYDYVNQRDEIVEFWGTGVDSTMDNECIYPVGLRNNSDAGYDFPDGWTDAEKGELVTQAINDQLQIAKQKRGTDDPDMNFHYSMYGRDLQSLYTNGHIEVPSDVTLIWCDDNCGDFSLPETFSDNNTHGIYYHVAYYGNYCKQQFYTATRLSRIETNYRDVIDNELTEYMLLNNSEILTYLPETKFIADLSWNADSAFAYNNAADTYTRWFTDEYFPIVNPAGDEIKAIVDKYYEEIDNPIPDFMWGFTKPWRQDKSYEDSWLIEERDNALQKSNTLRDIRQDALSIKDRLSEEDARIFYEFFIFPCELKERSYRLIYHFANAKLAADETEEYEHWSKLATEMDTVYDALEYVHRDPFGRWATDSRARDPMRGTDFMFRYLEEMNVQDVMHGKNIYCDTDYVEIHKDSGSTTSTTLYLDANLSSYETVRISFYGYWINDDEMKLSVNGGQNYDFPPIDGKEWDLSSRGGVYRIDIDPSDLVQGENTITFKNTQNTEKYRFCGYVAYKHREIEDARLELRTTTSYRWTDAQYVSMVQNGKKQLRMNPKANQRATVFNVMGRRIGTRRIQHDLNRQQRARFSRANGMHIIRVENGNRVLETKKSLRIR